MPPALDFIAIHAEIRRIRTSNAYSCRCRRPARAANVTSIRCCRPMEPSIVSTMTQTPALKFTGSDRFIRELRKRVDAYFENTGKRPRDCAQMYFKTATVLAWFFTAYFLLLFAVHSWWLIVPLAAILGV